MNPKYNLAVLETHPIPYRVPLYQKLAKNKKIDLFVYFCSDMSLKKEQNKDFGEVRWITELKGFNHKFLKNYNPFKKKSTSKGLWNFGIIKELTKNRPDAIIIYGYQSWTHRMALIASKIIGIPIIFRDEIDFIDYSSKFSKKTKNVILPILFKIPSAFLYSYTRSKEFYVSSKVPKEKLFFHPCAVNNKLFQKQSKQDDKKKLKKDLGFNSKSKIILYIGRLTKRKRVLDIIKAYSKIKVKEAYLLFIGGGDEVEKIKVFAKNNKLNNIKLVSFVPRKDLHKYYSIADLFVVASDYDPSPKVLNEAMNFSLPVIVSDRAGTAQDLVKQGKNGFIFKCGNINQLSKYMQKILKNKKMRKKMGKESLKIVSKWNFNEDVKATIKALDYIYKK